MLEKQVLYAEPVPEDLPNTMQKTAVQDDANENRQRPLLNLNKYYDEDYNTKKQLEHYKKSQLKSFQEKPEKSNNDREKKPLPIIKGWKDLFEILTEGRLTPIDVISIPGLKPSRLRRMLNSKRLKRRLAVLKEYAEADRAQYCLFSNWIALRKQFDLLDWSDPGATIQVCRDVLSETRKVRENQKIPENKTENQVSQTCQTAGTGQNGQSLNIAKGAFSDEVGD